MYQIKTFYRICFFAAMAFVFTISTVQAMSPGIVPRSSQILKTSFEPDTVKTDTITVSRKNIVSLDFLVMFPALGYSRIFQLSERTGLVLYGSITPYFGFTIDAGAALALGKKHHFFEPAGGYLILLDAFYVKAGYRYQGRKGLVLRIAPGYNISEKVPWLTASVGYAF